MPQPLTPSMTYPLALHPTNTLADFLACSRGYRTARFVRVPHSKLCMAFVLETAVTVLAMTNRRRPIFEATKGGFHEEICLGSAVRLLRSLAAAARSVCAKSR